MPLASLDLAYNVTLHNQRILLLITLQPQASTIMGATQKRVFTSNDGEFKIEISSANPYNGKIECRYECFSSPVGPLSIPDMEGRYMCVQSNKKEDTETQQVLINFKALKYQDEFSYVIVDTWNGYYETDDSMILTGSRCSVNENGKTVSTSLGTMAFDSLQRK